MAVAKEDIKEGWYWVRNREERKLFIVHVSLEPTFETMDSTALKVFHHGWEFPTEISEVIRTCDFIARIEPPEGL